jgi:hypothetical protein
MLSLVANFISRRERRAIPPLDGAWTPNAALDSCPVLVSGLEAPEDLIVSDKRLLVSVGNDVLAVDPRDPSARAPSVFHASGRVTGLCGHPSGGLVVCVAGEGVRIVGGELDGRALLSVEDAPVACALSAAVSRDGVVYIADASRTNSLDRWMFDLMEKRPTGRVIWFDPATERAGVCASQLAFPYGLSIDRDERSLLVCESWRHSIRRIPLAAGARPDAAAPVLTNLPGYPARIRLSQDGGYWLTFFALRTQLVEFVLTEDSFRRKMIDTIEPKYWICPSFYSSDYYLEPLQGGGIKQLGIKKPWAPPRSYGLVVRLGADLGIERSWHSRAGGNRHGLTSVCDSEMGTFVVSRGNGLVVAIRASEDDA